MKMLNDYTNVPSYGNCEDKDEGGFVVLSRFTWLHYLRNFRNVQWQMRDAKKPLA